MCFSALILTAALLAAGPPSDQEALGKFDLHAIPEASGIVKSRRYPGIFWVHNDSGNPPALFAIRGDGTIVREFRLAAPNVDWEDIADDEKGHLYVGDIGNNGGLLAIRAVYRIDEPNPDKVATAPLPIVAATFYALPRSDRFDAEGLYFDTASSSAIIVSKRFDRREAELFAVPFSPPAPLLRPATPKRIGVLPGFVEPATGASLSVDGQLLAVCSSTVIRIYKRSKGKDRPWHLAAELWHDGPEVEGITWDGFDLILVSEGRGVDRVSEAAWKRAEAAGRQAGSSRKKAR
jgi:hypothetical protein